MQKNIAEQFDIAGEFLSAVPYGEGHINATFKVLFREEGEAKAYLLQKINHNVFKDVDGLMRNIKLVTSHIKEKISNPLEGTLTVIPTKDGKLYYESHEHEFWRMYLFIENSIAYQKVDNADVFYKTAVAFGGFANQLMDFDASLLSETIPDFHNTKSRLDDFRQAVKNDKCNRLAEVRKEVDFILSREADCAVFMDYLDNGKLPLRVTHNDTKLNNVLFHDNTGECICIIDLDTVMPGLALSDFGDAIRFGASSAAEDETDLSKVFMRLDLFEMYTKGYLSQAKDSLTQLEKELLPFSAKLLTLECGMRFLADYLNGDTYFKIHREKHNLDRARTQLKLVADMEDKMEQMVEVVKKYS